MASVPADLRSVFQDQLNCAATEGRVPLTSLGLGPATLAAVAIVALQHPDVTRSEIIAAYDAFDREHPPRRWAAPRQLPGEWPREPRWWS